MIILKKPYITAKAGKLNKSNKYTFIVDNKANKPEIKKAIQKLYGVTVHQINTLLYPRKSVARRTQKGIIQGTKAAYKKAILTLPPGSSIDLQADNI